MEILSSTKNSSAEKQVCKANKLVRNCIIGLPLSVPPFPLFLSKLPTSTAHKPNHHIQSLVTETSHIVHNLHHSFLETADRCQKFLHLVSTQNPLFSHISSISSHYHEFCQEPFLSMSLFSFYVYVRVMGLCESYGFNRKIIFIYFQFSMKPTSNHKTPGSTMKPPPPPPLFHRTPPPLYPSPRIPPQYPPSDRSNCSLQGLTTIDGFEKSNKRWI